jgi:hypothetical protein
MSALEHARDRWGAAEVVDERSPEPLVSLLREFAELHADLAAGRLDELLGSALRPSVERYHGATMLTPAPGWWTCPLCGRRSDREGERGTARRFCVGAGRHGHVATEMRVER